MLKLSWKKLKYVFNIEVKDYKITAVYLNLQTNMTKYTRN